MFEKNLNRNSKLKPSRGRVFYNESGGLVPKLQFRTWSATVVKNTSGSGFLSFEFLFKFFLNILPLCLFLSYYPVIKLGESETMNFELSLPLLWLVMFDVVVVILMWKRQALWKGLKGKWWLWVLFPVWLTLSVVWSLNSLRGVLTVGILWLLYLAVYGMWGLRSLFDEEFRWRWWKWFFGSTLVVCGWCVVQCVLDLAGVSQEHSLMCMGCTYKMFGFPHPNGFAIEPQFMGNLLLAPTLAVGWLMLHSWPRPSGPSPRADGANPRAAALRNATSLKHYAILFFVFVATLFLTFSRGAIYAFVVATVFMSAFVVVRNRKERRTVAKRVGVMWLTVVGAFLFTLNLQGVMAQVSPTNDTYFDGVAKVVNHLTLGIVEIRGGEKGTSDNSPSEKIQALESGITGEDDEFDENGVVEKPVENFVENGAVFDGYVEESTEVRKRLTRDALTVWRGDFVTVMFGVGIGGAGQALYVNGLMDSPKEIVQNQYASLLLEVGAGGVSLFVLAVVLAVRVIWEKCPVEAGVILTLLVAYGVTLLFFSGLANALQIYLLPGILTVILRNDRVKAAE